MFRIQIAAIVFFISFLPICSIGSEGGKVSDAGFQRVKTFVKENVMDKTLESKVVSKIHHVEHGPSETEFFRRETFINFVETNAGIEFDVVSLIRQTVWPLDSEGKRSENPIVKDRVLVRRFGLRPSIAIDGATGTTRPITSTNGIRPGGGESVRAVATDGGLQLLLTTPLFYDSRDENGQPACQSFSETLEYKVENGLLTVETHEEDFYVDPQTMVSKRGSHDVTLQSKQVSGILQGIED